VSGCKKEEVQKPVSRYENTRYVECGKITPVLHDCHGEETSFKTPYGHDVFLACTNGAWKPLLPGPWYICDCGEEK